MSRFRPSVGEERWLALDAGGARTNGWRRVSFLARCGLFLLGAMTSGLLIALVELMHINLRAGALLLIVAAEFLIASRRLFFGGFEEALEVAAAVWIASSMHGWESDAGLWVLGGALCVVGIRLLNPLFTTVGVAACVAAAQPSAGVCYSIAALALAASNFTFRRPSYDRMLGWLMVVMPIAATVSSRHTTLSIVLACSFGGAALVVGIWRRMHAPLLAFLVCVGCTAKELLEQSNLSLEASFIIGGCVALLVAAAMDRYLRRGRGGITSRTAGNEDASTLLITALPTPTPGASNGSSVTGTDVQGGGGTFSGGGASGTF